MFYCLFPKQFKADKGKVQFYIRIFKPIKKQRLKRKPKKSHCLNTKTNSKANLFIEHLQI